MKYEKVIVEVSKNYLAEITLNPPEQLNALDSQMAGELYQALVEMDADQKVRVVLLIGAGKSFCAGIDVNELPGKSALEYREWIERMERPLVAISKMKKPVLAQLHGVLRQTAWGSLPRRIWSSLPITPVWGLQPSTWASIVSGRSSQWPGASAERKRSNCCSTAT
jgi:hypothetical protein